MAVLAAGCSEATDPSPAPPVESRTLTAVSATSLSGIVGAAATPAPAVRVTNASGNPVPGVPVFFGVETGAGRVGPANVVTDADGVATTTWTLGPTVTVNKAFARANGLGMIKFDAMSTPRDAAVVKTVSFLQGLSAAAGAPLGVLQVLVEDKFGNPIAGEKTTFVVTSGGGSIENAVVVTGADGIATSGVWTLGQPGQNAVSASIAAGTPATFTANAVPPGVDPRTSYTLESIRMGSDTESDRRSQILLGANRAFSTYVVIAHGDTLKSSGTYTVSGSYISFKYSDDFLKSLEEKLEYSPRASHVRDRAEEGVVSLDAIEIRRCWTEDCYESLWTFRRAAP